MSIHVSARTCIGSVIASFVLMVSSFSTASEPAWAESVDLFLVFQGTRGEDFSRPAPPYQRHVWFDVTWQNKSNKVVVGIEFQMRFIDAFGDVLHTSEVLKDSNRIEIGGSSELLKNTWFYEDSIVGRDTVYSKLAPGAAADTLRIHVAVLRVAYADGTVVSFEEHFAGDLMDVDRAAARRQRQLDESPWKPEPVYSIDSDQYFRTEPFTITTPSGNLRVTAIGTTQEVRLSVLVYDSSGTVVATVIYDTPSGTGSFWFVAGDIPLPAGTYEAELNPTMATKVSLRALESK